MHINEKDNAHDNRHLSITLKNEEQNNNGTIHIPISEILKSFRRFLLAWFVCAVFAILLVSAGIAAFSHQLSSAPVAMIGFNYSGAEKGLTPNGQKLDVNTIKNPAVIEAALTKLNYPLSNVESIRNAISIDGIIPTEAADEISLYKYAFEKNGNLQAAQSMLDIEYFPVKYKVTFDFSKTRFGDDEAAQVINTILECYRDYFFEQYGYSEAIGNSSLAVDYSDYDYLIAVDTYTDTLIELQDKIDDLKNNKSFRSTQTGYSFEDLSNAINIAKNYDADTLTAYILSNSVVNDKTGMISFYEYRIDELERQKKSAQDNLRSIENSIANYEKDSVVIHGDMDESYSHEYTTFSDKYDNLFRQKQTTQGNISYLSMKIAESNARLESIKKLSDGNASQKDIDYVEEKIDVLNDTVDQLVDAVNATIMEYHGSVTFANAYSVLVPANVLSKGYISMLLNNIVKPLLLVEVFIFFVYIIAAVINGFRTDSRKRKAMETKVELKGEE